MNRLRSFPKPVVVALNGVTMAGGLELAMCGDIILAAQDVRVADAHANFGVFPGAGGAAVLPRLVPLQTAMYMLLTGNSLTAQRLHELGMIAEVHPADALSEALQVNVQLDMAPQDRDLARLSAARDNTVVNTGSTIARH